MNLFSDAQALPQGYEGYFTPTEFSNILIQANLQQIQQGQALKLLVPHNDPVTLAQPNMAQLSYNGNMLDTAVLGHSFDVSNAAKTKRDWLLWVRELMDNALCYLEVPSEHHNLKVVCTRNLELVNGVSDEPIKDFELFLAIIKNAAELPQMLQGYSVEFQEAAMKAAEYLAADDEKSKRSAIAWLTKTFSVERAIVNSYIKAERALHKDPMESGKLFYLRLKPSTVKNGGYNISKQVLGTEYDVPTSAVILPLAFMRMQVSWLIQALQQGIVGITFLRDNAVERTVPATVNPALLQTVFKHEENKQAAISMVEDRGYIRVPDLCSTEISGTIYRSISVARIKSLTFIPFETALLDIDTLAQRLQPFGFDKSLASADLDAVVMKFKQYINGYQLNLKILQMIYTTLTGNTDTRYLVSPYQVIQELEEYVDKHVLLTTAFRSKLHLYMLHNPMLFPNYTGEVPNKEEQGISTATHRSLGVM